MSIGYNRKDKINLNKLEAIIFCGNKYILKPYSDITIAELKALLLELSLRILDYSYPQLPKNLQKHFIKEK